MSTAFNSNAVNVVAGLLLPSAILGAGAPSDDRLVVVLCYVALTAITIALATMGRGLDRRGGATILAGYLVFVGILMTR